MTLQEANSLIERADGLFRRAAQALDRGHNSGDKGQEQRMRKQCDACRARGIAMLEPLGIEVTFPSLYPYYKVDGKEYQTTEAAVSAALERNK